MNDNNFEANKKYKCELKFLDTAEVFEAQAVENNLICLLGNKEDVITKRLFFIDLKDYDNLNMEDTFSVEVTSHKGKETVEVYAVERRNMLIEV